MKFSLKIKLISTLMLFVIVPVGIQVTITYRNNVDALQKKAFEKLVSDRANKADQVEDLFAVMENQLITMAENPIVTESMRAFSREFHSIGERSSDSGPSMDTMKDSLRRYYTEQFQAEYESSNNGRDPGDLAARIDSLPKETVELQYYYISHNPNELGSKHLLLKAQDGSHWSELHSKSHPFFKTYLETFGYYDIFLVDAESGNIVYSVFKELDFATSLRTGPYKDTNFAELFRRLSDSHEQKPQVVDLKRYFPSYELPAGFIGIPIVDEGTTLGALIFQIPVEKIDKIMTSDRDWRESGFGESGETYLVGEDRMMRSMSRFLAEDSQNYFELLEDIGTPKETIDYIRAKGTTTISQTVESEGVHSALAGETGTRVFDDYRGVSVLSAYSLIDIEGLKWAILSEIDSDEAYASINSLVRKILLTSLLVIAFGSIVAWYIATSISRPIVEAGIAVKGIADGDLNQHVESRTNDEVGEMALSINDAITRIERAFGARTIEWVDLEEMRRKEIQAQEEARAERESAERARDEAQQAARAAEREKDNAQRALNEAEEARAQAEQEEAAAAQAKREADKAIAAAKVEKEKANDALERADQAKNEADSALATAEEEKRKAEDAKREAASAKKDAQEALELAQREKQNAAQSMETARKEQQAAEEANASAEKAREEAAEALTVAKAEKQNATRASNDAQQAMAQATEAKEDAQAALERAESEKQKAADATQTAEREQEKAREANALAEASRIEAAEALDLATAEKEKAEIANRDAQDAIERAKDAECQANDERESAEVARNEALKAKEEAERSNERIESLLKDAEDESQKLQQKVTEILSVVNLASEGDLSERIEISGEDPIGQVGEGLARFFEGISEDLRAIDQAATRLKSSGGDLLDNGDVLGRNANDTEEQSRLANEAGANVLRGAETVATSMEELSSAARDIAQKVAESSKLTTEASNRSKETTRLIEELGRSSTAVGSVTKLITSIAEQTNLLALNATIEAARAGDAGKGFAVVAGEVKDLAKQSATASSEISSKISAIQQSTKAAVLAIGEIDETIQKVNEHSDVIAGAMEEQSSTSASVNRIVAQSVKDIEGITANIEKVEQAAINTRGAVESNNASANELSELATDLGMLVGKFRLS